MKIAVVQASTQAAKNDLLFRYTKKYAKACEVINFGCFPGEEEQYSYIDTALLIGLLLNRQIADFVVTGCSSGQGMMLACNSMPGVLCGYVPTPKDAFLFAQINNGNAVSLPLGEEYTYLGEDNLEQTLKSLFSKPFGGGCPAGEASRKLADSVRLKEIKRLAQISFDELINKMDPELIESLENRIYSVIGDMR